MVDGGGPLVGRAGAGEAEVDQERLAGLREEPGERSGERGQEVEEPDGRW